jgi:hypothetical protein
LASAPSAAVGLTVDTSNARAGMQGFTYNNAGAVTVSGTAEANAIVTLYEGAASIGQATANAAGDWTATTSSLPDGSHTLSSISVDVAGNTSLPSNLGVSIDTAVLPPTIVLQPSSDTFGAGTTGTNSDRLTARTDPVVTGNAEANSQVIVYDGGVSVGQAQANSAGIWNYTLGVGAGLHTLSARAIDFAGNVSGLSGNLIVTVDTTAAAMPAPSVAGTSDSGRSSTDTITNVTTPVILGTGAEANALVVVYGNGVSIGQGLADAAGNYSITPAALGDGSYQLSTRQVDLAGNTSGSSPISALTVDTSVNVPTTRLLNDTFGIGTTGTGNDGLTKDSVLTIGGTAEVNAIVTLYDGGISVGQATANAGGSWTATSAVLSDGNHTLSAVAVDVAGNTSAASGALVVTVDQTPDFANPGGLSTATDSTRAGYAPGVGDSVTNVASPTLVGVGTPGARVIVMEGGVSLGEATVNAGGSWSAALSGALSGDGVHSLTFTEIDPAGNTGVGTTPLTITLDTVAAAPALPMLAAANDSGRSAVDGITNATTPTYSGSGAEVLPAMSTSRAVI